MEYVRGDQQRYLLNTSYFEFRDRVLEGGGSNE